MAHECKSYTDYEKGKCFSNSFNHMGLNASSITSQKKYFLKTLSDKVDPPYCRFLCQYNQKLGYCSKQSDKTNCQKVKTDDCNNKKDFWCCDIKVNFEKKDITFIINNENTEHTNLINFVSNFIKNIEIGTENTRIAIMSYNSSNIKILTYLNQINNQEELLNIIESIKSFKEDQNKQSSNIENALTESMKIFLVENGMRE